METLDASQHWWALLLVASVWATDTPGDVVGEERGRLSGRTIALDAGHEPPFPSSDCQRCRWMGSGGSSHFYDVRLSFPGHPLAVADGPYAGALAEHLFNQDLVHRVAALLRRAGADVVLTRVASDSCHGEAVVDSLVQGEVIQIPLAPGVLSDLVRTGRARNTANRVPLMAVVAGNDTGAVAGIDNLLARGERANRAGADLALVFHADAVNDPSARGRLLFVYAPGDTAEHDSAFRPPPDGPSIDLARAIDAALEGLEGIPQAGIYGRDLWYLSIVQMPAVLIEIGRLTNQLDAEWLSVSANRQATAEAIAGAVESYLADGS